jgi:hypothetical protein
VTGGCLAALPAAPILSFGTVLVRTAYASYRAPPRSVPRRPPVGAYHVRVRPCARLRAALEGVAVDLVEAELGAVPEAALA